jgi:hypothetical protein
MSKYELIDYDRLLERIGIPDPNNWQCGANYGENFTYDELGLSYDEVIPYDGRSQQIAGGMCLTGDVNVNGLLLNYRDINGTVWVCTEIDGWWTTPPSEIPDVPRPYWDGSMLTTGRYLARDIVVSGVFIPPRPSLVPYNRDLLIRASSIVRGIGLLATCDDPAKTGIIQTSDVPLIQTTKTTGFTEFSLSFRSVEPTKQSVAENLKTLSLFTTQRAYVSFAADDWVPGVVDPSDTTYLELEQGAGIYENVKVFNPGALIPDETNIPVGTPQTDGQVFDNDGNYFAFPVYVFRGPYTLSTTNKLVITNLETGETMEIIKNIAADEELVVDTRARRVGLVEKTAAPKDWKWNARGHLSLTSDWVTLAPGRNQFSVTLPTSTIRNAPEVYWRDSWIG